MKKIYEIYMKIYKKYEKNTFVFILKLQIKYNFK